MQLGSLEMSQTQSYKLPNHATTLHDTLVIVKFTMQVTTL